MGQNMLWSCSVGNVGSSRNHTRLWMFGYRGLYFRIVSLTRNTNTPLISLNIKSTGS